MVNFDTAPSYCLPHHLHQLKSVPCWCPHDIERHRSMNDARRHAIRAHMTLPRGLRRGCTIPEGWVTEADVKCNDTLILRLCRALMAFKPSVSYAIQPYPRHHHPNQQFVCIQLDSTLNTDLHKKYIDNDQKRHISLATQMAKGPQWANGTSRVSCPST
jgi:hypothetical protein